MYPYWVICEFEDKKTIFVYYIQSYKKANELCRNFIKQGIYSICYDASKFPDLKFKIYSDQKLNISEHPQTKTTIDNPIMSN